MSALKKTKQQEEYKVHIYVVCDGVARVWFPSDGDS